jgi:hypothetical protein
MAVVVAGGRARTAQAAGMQWREQGARSPEMAPPPRPARAAVVYYLSRNGHLEHPHFMEVALSCPADGLYLRGTYGVCFAIAFCRSIESFLVERSVMELVRSVCGADVVDRLDALRSKGMARMYSWASKRLGSLHSCSCVVLARFCCIVP